jgi:large subunit ribosomal protein L30e
MKTIEKVIKDAVEAEKYKSGVKEVTRSVKGSKLIIISRSLDSQRKAKLQEQASQAGVPVYEFEGNSIQLGKLCNMPFRVTTIALRAGTDQEISALFEKSAKEQKPAA